MGNMDYPFFIYRYCGYFDDHTEQTRRCGRTVLVRIDQRDRVQSLPHVPDH